MVGVPATITTTREGPLEHTHASTPRDRAAWVGHLLARRGEYGVVTAPGWRVGVSRQTLHAWVERGQAALGQAFAPPATGGTDAQLERDILTLLVGGTPACILGRSVLRRR